MVAVLTLAEAKAHAVVEHDDADELINGYIAAAEDYLGRIGCLVDADPVPAVLKQAALLLVGHWFENREAVGPAQSELPLGFNALVASAREVTV